MEWLKRFYRQLPVIRELREVSEDLRQIHWHTKQVLKTVHHLAYGELLAQPKYADPKRLNRFEHKVFSQNGEDGMIAEIFRRIGTTSRFFVEIGVGNGRENNTAFLLTQGWHGTWIDGDAASLETARRECRSMVDAGMLRIKLAHISSANVATIFQDLEVPAEFDLLSLDIDRNTYWVMAALRSYRPRAIVVEYNAAFPASVDWKVEDAPDKGWNGTSYFGASLKAYERLAADLGYALVGCDVTGTNAFLIRNDLCGGKFAEPYTAENHHEPPRYFLIRQEGFPPMLND